MTNEKSKIKLLEFKFSDQDYLVKLVTEIVQGNIVSEELVSSLVESKPDLQKYNRIWMLSNNYSAKEYDGAVILQKINAEHRSAQLVIILENPEKYQDYDLLKEIYGYVANYVFHELDFNRLQVEVLECNLKLKKAYKKIGLYEEGLLRNKYQVNEKLYDVYVMSMLRIEWERMQVQ